MKRAEYEAVRHLPLFSSHAVKIWPNSNGCCCCVEGRLDAPPADEDEGPLEASTRGGAGDGGGGDDLAGLALLLLLLLQGTQAEPRYTRDGTAEGHASGPPTAMQYHRVSPAARPCCLQPDGWNGWYDYYQVPTN